MSDIILTNTVIAIQGNAVSNVTPTTNQILEFNGSEWALMPILQFKVFKL